MYGWYTYDLPRLYSGNRKFWQKYRQKYTQTYTQKYRLKCTHRQVEDAETQQSQPEESRSGKQTHAQGIAYGGGAGRTGLAG